MERALRIGPYEVLGLLGRGGSANVYAVREPGNRVERALKVLGVGTPTRRERMAREARVQRRVTHDNVLPLLDVVYLPDGIALLLPLVDGPTLAALIAAGPLGEDAAWSLFRDVVAGVAAIHRARLVHRDLKPANVLLEVLGAELAVRVADFGLARGEDDGLTEVGAVLGTTAYLAPEVRAGGPATPRSDVFALGLVLCELLTGQRSAEPLAGSARDLALRCLDPDPARRPADAEALREALPPPGPRPADLVERARALIQRARPLPGPPEDRPALPPERDGFVGRHDELGALAAAVDRSRLVSLLGSPGVGKSRLSLRYATLWRDAWPGGVSLCPLADASTEQELLLAVARTLGVPVAGDPAPIERLGLELARRGPCLVILDNVEQLVEALGAPLERWRALAPDARFLATSRRRLGLAGEEPIRLGPLTPADGAALLVRRADARVHGWGDADPDAVAELVRLLDGLPLAIELAAARASLVSPRSLVGRLTERFRLLTASGAAPDRHTALRATLDWSFRLLSPDEQRALARVSVFEGGFGPEAGEVVLELDPVRARELLEGLVDHSLLHPTGPGRLAMLVSVQEYAALQLDPAGAADASAAHARYFARFGAPAALAAIEGPRGIELAATLAIELPNLLAACRRSVRADRGSEALAALAAARIPLDRTGPAALAVELADAVVGIAGGGRAGAVAVRSRGEALRLAGRGPEARGVLQDALTAAAGEPDLEARALAELGLLHVEQGRTAEASACYARALPLYRAVGDRSGEAFMRLRTGVLELVQGRVDVARAHYEAALEGYRALGDRTHEAVVLGNLGNLHQEQGQLDEAAAYHEAGLALHRETGNRRSEGTVLGNLGNVRSNQGRSEEAQRCYEAAISAHRQIGNRRSEGIVLGNLGLLHRSEGRPEEALACYERALALARETGFRREEGALLGRIGLVTPDPLQAEARFEAGLAILREIGDRVQEANLLGNLARRFGAAEPERARRALDQALAISRETSAHRLEAMHLIQRAELAADAGELAAAEADLAIAEVSAAAIGDPKLQADARRVRQRIGEPRASG